MTEKENILIDALISAGHIAEQARTAIEKLKAENVELRHRAEVVERALLLACANLVKDEKDNVDIELLARVVYTKFLRKAEKELSEGK